MELTEILNNVLAQSGFLERSSFTNSNDPDDKQMVAIANRAAYEIMNFYNWTELRRSAEINLNDTDVSYDLPADYQSFIPDSAWETDGSRKVDVPVPDAEWYQYKFSSLTSSGIIRARFYGKKLEVAEPFVGGKISFEYISGYPILNSLNEQKQTFTEDTDTWLLDDQLLILGIQAHWQQTKMMPTYSEHMGNYMVKMAEAISRSNQGQTIGGSSELLRRDPYTKLWVN